MITDIRIKHKDTKLPLMKRLWLVMKFAYTNQHFALIRVMPRFIDAEKKKFYNYDVEMLYVGLSQDTVMNVLSSIGKFEDKGTDIVNEANQIIRGLDEN